MLDSDVAKLYNCETKYVNRVVKRNIERFPEEFCFQLEQEEFQNLRCQFVTSSFEKQNYGGRRYMPYVFTKQGIAMLSALLKSEIAVNVSIQIMKAFIEMRNFLFYNGQVFQEINAMKSLIQYLINYKVKKKNKDVEVVILTSQNCDISKLDINKFNKQYPTLKIARSNKFHDRFIIIDNKELYHCGASLKDLGKKCFAISKIEDMEYIEKISHLF